MFCLDLNTMEKRKICNQQASFGFDEKRTSLILLPTQWLMYLIYKSI